MKIGIVGATGMVGAEMIKVLSASEFAISELILGASEASVGKRVRWKNSWVSVQSVQGVLNSVPDVTLFSAGSDPSLKWAPQFADRGSIVIDNSSAWRMDPDIKLIVPEVNDHELDGTERIIANPNCSTIQLVVAIAPLHRAFGIKRLVISTYQSVTGTGKKALQQLRNEQRGEPGEAVYPHPIANNCLPHCDVFFDNGYTKEELKLVRETRKILGEPDMRITATAVRVPVWGGHSESVNIEFENPYDMAEIRQILSQARGIKVQDDWQRNSYPMPLYAKGKDDVFVGRIRRDESIENGLNLWVVADNLRKGAATNAVQIAEHVRRIENPA